MEEKQLLSYLKLINIKTLNGYYKYLFTLIGSICLTSLVELGIPYDIYSNFSLLIDNGIILLNVGGISLLARRKYKKNKKEFLKDNNINIKTTVKECYDILKKEEVILKDMPTDNIVSRYYLSPDNYYTEKGKKLVRKR